MVELRNDELTGEEGLSHRTHVEDLGRNPYDTFDKRKARRLPKTAQREKFDLREELTKNGITGSATDSISAVWVWHYASGLLPEIDLATALAVDESGNEYVTEESGSMTSFDYTTIKYTSAGDTVWVRRYNGQENSFDHAAALAVDSNENVYVTGSSFSLDRGIYTTIKYTQTPVSVEEQVSRRLSGYALKQNYPNPFNPSTRIDYDVASTSHVKLSVVNILGQEVARLVNEEQHAGKYKAVFDATNLPSGVYFYKLQVTPVRDGASALTGTLTTVRKMMLLK